MHFKTQLLNMAFYVLTALLLFGIVKYVRAALMLQTGPFSWWQDWRIIMC
mgnify:CR=1 FL=1